MSMSVASGPVFAVEEAAAGMLLEAIVQAAAMLPFKKDLLEIDGMFTPSN
jgi:hypothetical protein